MSEGRVKFVPGTGVCLVGSGLVVLTDADVRSEFIALLRESLRATGSFADAVAIMLAGDLDSIPTVAIASFEGGGATVRTIVRGGITVRAHRGADVGEVVWSGAEVATWTERVEVDVERVSIHFDDDLSSVGLFEIAEGVVPATRVELASPSGPPASPPSGESRHHALVPPDQVDWPASPFAAPANTPPPLPDRLLEPRAGSADADGPSVAGPTDEGIESLADSQMQPPSPAEDIGVSAVEQGEEPTLGAEEGASPDDGESASGIVDEAPTAAVSSTDDLRGGARLSGATIRLVADDLAAAAASNEAVASRPESVGDNSEQLPDAHGGDGLADADADTDAYEVDDEFDHLFGATQYRSVAEAGIDVADEASVAGGEVIRSVPSAVSALSPNAGAAEGSATDEGDHDGMTVSLAQLRASGVLPSTFVPHEGDAVVAPSGVTVHAVRCLAGHLNPPSAVACRQCSIEIPPQAHVSVQRPSLGKLVFSDGQEFVVTSPALLGRAPKASGQINGEVPELVTLPSSTKELSSTHLEVRIEGWQVIVVDRRSTNGTTVQLPLAEPQRLHPGEPFPIVPGTIVDLAEEVQFVYEASS